MINLLPELYKLQFSREYRWRVAVIALLFLDALVITASILLVPSFLQSAVPATGAALPAVTKDAAKQAANLHAGLLAQTATLSTALKALTSGATPVPFFTDVMTAIGADKPKAVSVTSISYSLNSVSDDSSVSAALVMRGVAATRDDLARFVAALKAEKQVSNVQVPISDYAADTSVPFTITVTAS